MWGLPRTGEFLYEASVEVRAQWPMVIVKIDADVVVPAELDGVSVVDLGDWIGGEDLELARLVGQLEQLAGHRLSRSHGQVLSPRIVEGAELAVDQITALMAAVGQLDDVLVEDDV